MNITWNHLNDLETSSYELQALVDVLQDAVLNDTSGFNRDSVATVLSIVSSKAAEIKDIVEEVYISNRQAKEVVAEEEEAEDLSIAEVEEPAPEDIGTLSVTEVEDGVFTVTASFEEMNRIFSAFITQAIIKGIETQEAENESWANLRKAAADLEQFPKVWEESDELDYAPEVKDRRVALTKVLDQLKGLTQP